MKEGVLMMGRSFGEGSSGEGEELVVKRRFSWWREAQIHSLHASIG